MRQLQSACPGRAQSSGESEPAVDKPKGPGEVREKEEPWVECALGGRRDGLSRLTRISDSMDHCGLDIPLSGV